MPKKYIIAISPESKIKINIKIILKQFWFKTYYKCYSLTYNVVKTKNIHYIIAKYFKIHIFEKTPSNEISIKV